MARKKSLAAEVLATLKKNKEARLRAEREAAKAWERAAREQKAEDLRRLREEERRAGQERAAAIRAREAAALKQQKEAEQLRRQHEKERLRQEAAADKQRRRRADQEARALQQRAAEVKKEEARRRLGLRQSEAVARTAAVAAQLQEFDDVLRERTRELQSVSGSLEDGFRTSGSIEFVDRLHGVLSKSSYPQALRGGSRAGFYPEAQEIRMEYDLPRLELVPPVTEYRYVRSTDEIRAVPRKEADVKRMYGDLLAKITLRVVSEVFDATPPSLVRNVVFNGHVSAKDRATGQPIHPCLISVYATREAFGDLILDEPELDPVRALRHLNAVVSPHPYDLESVRPVAEFDLSKYKFVEEMDVVAGMDSRPDLLALKPVEFEQLVRRLFEGIGLKAWVTQGSRDDGVDAVALNEDPILGGICVIQAKRYKNIVGVESVNALAGVMNDKAAARGILVTTSWFGKASYEFAARTGRMQLIDGRELKSMLEEHLGIKALIGLPKVPPGWQAGDVK